jgi:hypothetical protein
MFANMSIGTKYTRPALGDIWGMDWHCFSKGAFTPRGGGKIILFVTRIKQDSLTQYNDFISGGLAFWEGEISKRNDGRIRSASRSGEEDF